MGWLKEWAARRRARKEQEQQAEIARERRRVRRVLLICQNLQQPHVADTAGAQFNADDAPNNGATIADKR